MIALFFLTKKKERIYTQKSQTQLVVSIDFPTHFEVSQNIIFIHLFLTAIIFPRFFVLFIFRIRIFKVVLNIVLPRLFMLSCC